MRTFAVICAILLVCFVAGTAKATTHQSCYVNVWVGGQEYNGFVTRSYRTSCPFARRVTARSLRFIVNHGGEGDGDFFVNVFSPVTFKTYRMHCLANGSLYSSEQMHVTCRGGIGAMVRYVASSG
jgi:hypothetical protein